MAADITHQLESYFVRHKKQGKIVVLVFVLSIFTVFTVFSMLLRPAISMECRNLDVSANPCRVKLGKEIPVHVSAAAVDGQKTTVFLLSTKSADAGLSKKYVFQKESIKIPAKLGQASLNSTSSPSENSTSHFANGTVLLHRQFAADGNADYYFMLNEHQTADFTLNYISNSKVKPPKKVPLQKDAKVSAPSAESAAVQTVSQEETKFAKTSEQNTLSSEESTSSATKTSSAVNSTALENSSASSTANSGSQSLQPQNLTITFLAGKTLKTVDSTMQETTSSNSSTASSQGKPSSLTLTWDASTSSEVSATKIASGAAQKTAAMADYHSAGLQNPNHYSINPNLSYKLIQSDSDTYTNTKYYHKDCALGVAGNFGVVAFDTAALYADTCSNVLAKNLQANVNFGTRNLEELSYVQNYQRVHPTSASCPQNVLVVGSSNSVSVTDNGNHFAVNGTKIDCPNTIWQDADTSRTPFINLEKVKAEVDAISLELKEQKNANVDASHLNKWGGSCNESYLQLTKQDGVGVYNIKASELSQYNRFGVKGLHTGTSGGAVVINVDCSGVKTLNMPISKIEVDGQFIGFNETTQFRYNKVIWNFVNCDPSLTINTQLLYGVVLAPDATINVMQNLNGTIIGNNVNIRGENHRDDFVGKLTNDITVRKVWKDSSGNVMTGKQVENLNVKVQLYQDDEAFGSPVILNQQNGWSYTWHDLNEGGCCSYGYWSYTTWCSGTSASAMNDGCTCKCWNDCWCSGSNWSYVLWYSYGEKHVYQVKEIEVTDSGGKNVTDQYTTSYSNPSGSDGVITITNQKKDTPTYTLPVTGGGGVVPIYFIGILLLLCGIAGAYFQHKHRCRDT